ncbi:MAG: hypothetical protein HGA97_04760 [Chlorobiaceae bacterium]|nr:hypothetical protein [Chlorobiaceae bacterium]
MGLKWLFTIFISVLLHPEAFWENARKRFRRVNALRDYAAPVIAMVQLFKLPFIGSPRAAMLITIISFVIDVAILYLLAGAAFSGVSTERTERVQNDIMTVLCFSMTPLWLAEPFYFIKLLKWIVVAAALVYTLLISRLGMQAMFKIESRRRDAFFLKLGFLIIVATAISFMLLDSLTRYITSF